LIPDKNLSVYEQPDVVHTYVHHNALTKAEAFLFTKRADDYINKQVLDIGVGAGRTTKALAGLSAEYFGIDYSAAMVEICKQRFANLSNARFAQDDARVLSACNDNSFDAAVFSFNGIDTMDMEGRKAVLIAVKRVLKPTGIFVFSFHNSGYLNSLYRYNWPKNPLRWAAAYKRRQRLQEVNGPREKYSGQDIFFLKDGGEDFRLNICYIRPSLQMDMLKELGFEVIDCLESLSGKVLSLNELDASTASWIYYRCRQV
jgi:ubiquinone/menaquinone biosynthesis C-methylase UbiE